MGGFDGEMRYFVNVAIYKYGTTLDTVNFGSGFVRALKL